MSEIVANIKRCKKCKNIYDANIGLNMIRCPYCLQKQKQDPIFIPIPPGKRKPIPFGHKEFFIDFAN